MTFYMRAGHKHTYILYVAWGQRICQHLQAWRQGETLSLYLKNLTLTEDVLNGLKSKPNLHIKDSVRTSKRTRCTFH
jgi:hypothetical protein